MTKVAQVLTGLLMLVVLAGSSPAFSETTTGEVQQQKPLYTAFYLRNIKIRSAITRICTATNDNGTSTCSKDDSACSSGESAHCDNATGGGSPVCECR